MCWQMTNESRNRVRDGWMNGWMDEWMDARISGLEILRLFTGINLDCCVKSTQRSVYKRSHQTCYNEQICQYVADHTRPINHKLARTTSTQASHFSSNGIINKVYSTRLVHSLMTRLQHTACLKSQQDTLHWSIRHYQTIITITITIRQLFWVSATKHTETACDIITPFHIKHQEEGNRKIP